jgi:hypothetical protein
MSVKIAEQPKYLGHEVHFYESHFDREVGKYERFCNGMAPIVQELKRIGLSDLTSESMARLVNGFNESLVDELRALANRDVDKVGFVFKPVYGEAIEKAAASLRSFLTSRHSFLTSGWEYLDVPIVEGEPTVTDEFKQQLREKYNMRIRTKEGSLFYEKFLEAKAAVRELIQMGYMPEAAYEFDATEGLQIRHMDL